MNGIDELRDTLRERVEAQEQTPMVARMASVRRRRSARRRTRVVVALAGASAVVAATVVAAPAFDDLTDREPPAVGEEETDIEGAVDVFAERLDGDTLVASTLGEVGQSEISWTLTLEDVDVTVERHCRVPQRFDPELGGGAAIASTLEVNGQPVGSALCDVSDEELFGYGTTLDVVRETSASWQEAGVRAGEPFTLTVRLEDRGEPIQIDRAQLGLGIYEPTGERVAVGGVGLPRIVGVDNWEYSLVDTATAPAGPGALARLDVPDGASGLIVYGWVDATGNAMATLSAGRGAVAAWFSGDGLLQYPQEREPSPLRLTVDRGPAEGMLVLAYYAIHDGQGENGS